MEENAFRHKVYVIPFSHIDEANLVHANYVKSL